MNQRDDSGQARGTWGKINFDQMGRVLIFASLGLGALEVLRPKQVQKMVGVRGKHTGLIRFLGFRELASALLIFSQSRPLQGVLARVLGDAMDLGLLGAAFTQRRAKKDRLAIATAAIAGITALDALTAAQIRRVRAREREYSFLTPAELSGSTRSGAFHVLQSITINSSPNELYQYWRNFQNLPRFMYHLEAVGVIDERRSHWMAKAPAGTHVEWDAEITEDRPNELIAWRSVENAQVPNSGSVRFQQGPAGRGTVVRVDMEYRPPAGKIGKLVAKLFGEEPSQQVADDLRRFKQIIETGEVVRSDATMAGSGQKVQPSARPMPDNKVREKLSDRVHRADLEGQRQAANRNTVTEGWRGE